MVTARTYQSPLRDAQAALTRERILMAAMGYLEKHDIETLTLRHVAELSGVSPPTVYAHFPTMEALVERLLPVDQAPPRAGPTAAAAGRTDLAPEPALSPLRGARDAVA